jgi:hypothetical protein
MAICSPVEKTPMCLASFLDLRHHGGDALLDFGTHGLPIASVVTIASS